MTASFKDHFSSRAAAYAAFRPSYPEALADRLAGLAPARLLALDVGCGSGQLSTLLAARFDRVVATDASAAQIENAAPHPRVAYRCAPAEASGLDDASVDLITAAQAAHWFGLDAFYREVRRVLVPRGAIALISYGVIEADGAAGETLARFYAALGPYWPPERRHVETGYRGLPFPFDEIEAPRLAMSAEWPLAGVLGYVETWSALRGMERALGPAPLARFAEELAAAWGEPAAAHQIRWPLALRLGRV
ncbi:MAG: class I SAM-dependent methyltransferase [Alphaproteobacteria bacterium]